MTSLSEAAADRLAEPALFASLVDDAALFPPGNAPLQEAVRLHRGHLSSRYAAWLGPLLVPASAAADLIRIAAGGDVLRVGVIARPGTAASDLLEGLSRLQAAAGVEVVGVEMGWSPGWRDVALDGLPLSLEVPRGIGHAEAIADIAQDESDNRPLQAKFRTGATETWAWPDEEELASFIRAAVDHDLGFKLTGGLHHAVRGQHGGEEQHGLLNVIAAVRWALNGEEVHELAPLLAERDPAVLVAMVTRMSAADASIVRAFFTSYGCCDVTDPIGELTALNLIEEI